MKRNQVGVLINPTIIIIKSDDSEKAGSNNGISSMISIYIHLIQTFLKIIH